MIKFGNAVIACCYSIIVVNSFGGCGGGGGGGGARDRDSGYRSLDGDGQVEEIGIWHRLATENNFRPFTGSSQQGSTNLGDGDRARLGFFARRTSGVKLVANNPIYIYDSPHLVREITRGSKPSIAFRSWNGGQCGQVRGYNFRLGNDGERNSHLGRIGSNPVSIDVLLSDANTLPETGAAETCQQTNTTMYIKDFIDHDLSKKIAHDVDSMMNESDRLNALIFAVWNVAKLWSRQERSNGVDIALNSPPFNDTASTIAQVANKEHKANLVPRVIILSKKN